MKGPYRRLVADEPVCTPAFSEGGAEQGEDLLQQLPIEADSRPLFRLSSSEVPLGGGSEGLL